MRRLVLHMEDQSWTWVAQSKEARASCGLTGATCVGQEGGPHLLWVLAVEMAGLE